MNDEEVRKYMGENAYKKLKTNLSWGNIAEKTIEVNKIAMNEHKKEKRYERTNQASNLQNNGHTKFHQANRMAAYA